MVRADRLTRRLLTGAVRDSMATEPPKRDWAKTWVHAFFGALFGGFLGFRA